MISFNIICVGSRQLGHTIKTYHTSDCWSRDMLNFYFLTKGLGLVSPPHFLHYFLGKLLLMLHSINWPNFIVWLPLLLDISGNVCIVIVLSSFFPRYVKYVNKQKKKNFWDLPKLSNQAVFLHDQKFRTKIEICQERKELKVK